jgi:hypothetical protein
MVGLSIVDLGIQGFITDNRQQTTGVLDQEVEKWT